MDVKTQIIIRSNPNIYKYLREESYWYKYLNRDPSSIKDLERKMKTKYKLTAEDKLESITNRINLLYSFMDAFK